VIGKLAFFAMILALATAVFPVSASCQAAAESVLLGAGSSTAAVKAGSGLNSALNRSSKRLAERIQQEVSTPPAKTPRGGQQAPKKSAAGATVYDRPQQGTMIVSIVGAHPNCPASNQATSTTAGKAAAAPTEENCMNQNTSKPETARYKSVVTLSFPK